MCQTQHPGAEGGEEQEDEHVEQGWRFCDVTDLVCPAANSGASQVAVSKDSLSDERVGTTANKRARFLKTSENDQPDLSPVMMS